MRRYARDAVPDEITRERLGAAAGRLRTPARQPLGLRFDKRPAVGAHEHPADGARGERESEVPQSIRGIVRSPGVITEDRVRRRRHGVRHLEQYTIRGTGAAQALSGLLEPLVAAAIDQSGFFVEDNGALLRRRRFFAVDQLQDVVYR